MKLDCVKALLSPDPTESVALALTKNLFRKGNTGRPKKRPSVPPIVLIKVVYFKKPCIFSIFFKLI